MISVILDDARACIEGMKAATTYEIYGRHWRSFLIAIDQVVSKLENAVLDNPALKDKLANLKGRRKNDPLLAYIWKARNATVHQNTLVYDKAGAATTYKAVNGPVTISRGCLKGDGTFSAVYSGELEVVFHPEAIRLVPITDNNIEYPPPSIHMGRPLSSLKPVDMAVMVLAFYEAELKKLGF